jgi:hypothetical protein
MVHRAGHHLPAGKMGISDHNRSPGATGVHSWIHLNRVPLNWDSSTRGRNDRAVIDFNAWLIVEVRYAINDADRVATGREARVTGNRSIDSLADSCMAEIKIDSKINWNDRIRLINDRRLIVPGRGNVYGRGRWGRNKRSGTMVLP